MDTRIRKLSYAALFIAISVILSRFFAGDLLVAGTSVLRISFGQIPLYLAGILLGPVYGGVCGAIADLIGYPLKPLGPYFPGFTVSAALTGMIPGVFAKLNSKQYSWMWLLIVIIITELITSIGLNTLWLNMITGRAVWVLLPPTLISRAVLIPVYVSIVKLLLKYSKRVSPSLR